jgi:hypothetical protein
MEHIKITPVIDNFNKTWGFQLRNIDPVQAQIVKSIIMCNYMTDLDYIERQKVNAFLQGFSYDAPGEWVYVELWTRDTDRINQFCQYVEEQINSEERYNLEKRFL